MPTLGTFKYDNLFAGKTQPVVTDSIILAAGQSYVKGTVLGLADNGQAKAVDSKQTDGTQTPYAVLAEDVDAREEAKPGIVYLTGEFNEAALVFGGEDTADTHKVALRKIGIFV